MKLSLFFVSLLIGSYSHALFSVASCKINLDRQLFEVNAFSNSVGEQNSRASMKSEISGKLMVSTDRDAKYQGRRGQAAIELVNSEPIFQAMATKIKATPDIIKRGVEIYSFGNFSDDGSGVVLAVFHGLTQNGLRTNVLMHAWAGIQICQPSQF